MNKLLEIISLFKKEMEFVIIGRKEEEPDPDHPTWVLAWTLIQRFFVYQLVTFLVSDFLVKCGIGFDHMASLLARITLNMAEFISR